MNTSQLPENWFENYTQLLNNNDRKVRLQCLDKVRSILSKDTVKVTNKSFIISSVIKLAADSSEACREKSLQLVIMVVEKWEVNEEFLPVIVNQIYSKMGAIHDLETSEEVKKLHLKLLNVILNKYDCYLFVHVENIVSILKYSITDSCPEVKRMACECTDSLAKTVGMEISPYSEILIELIIKNTKFPQYKVRVAAVKSLQYLVENGNRNCVHLSCEQLEHAILDTNVHVRQTVLNVVSFWLMKLPGRYSVFDKLIPIVLVSLCEEIKDVRKEGEDWWYKIGEQYLVENEDKYKDLIDYEPDITQHHYPENVKRPSLGCRLLIKKEMTRIIPNLLSNLLNWMEGIRILSAKVFKMLVLHAESNIVQYLDKILPIVYRVFKSNEISVCKPIYAAMEIMGYFVPVSVYCELILPELKEFGSVGHYQVLAALLSTSQKEDVLESTDRIAEILSSSSVCSTQDVVCQESLLCILSDVIKYFDENTMEKVSSESVYLLYICLLTVSGFAEEKQQKVDELIDELRKCNKFASLTEMNRRYFEPLLARLIEQTEIWNEHSADFHIFLSILSKYFSDLANENFDQFLDLMYGALSPTGPRETVYKTLLLFIDTVRKPEIMKKVDDLDMLVREIITGPLKPLLVWRPGRVAELTRCSTMILIGDLLKCIRSIPKSITEMMLSLIVPCCEDGLDLMRINTLKCITRIAVISNEKHNLNISVFNDTVSAVLGRLDDKSDDVRHLSVPALHALLSPNIPPQYKSPKNEQILFIYKTLLVYLKDDKDQKQQFALLDLLKDISYIQPRMLLKTVQPADQIRRDFAQQLAQHILSNYSTM